MKKLLREKQNADTECDGCGERFPLWDVLEKKFASKAVRAQVEQLQADDLAKLDTRRRGKLLALEVGARITSADQKCFEIRPRRTRGWIWSWNSPMTTAKAPGAGSTCN